MSIPLWLLAAGVVDVLLVLNALHSVQRIAVLVVPSFFAAWLPIETPWHMGVLMLLLLCVLISMGGLAAWPGWLGTLLVIASVLGLWPLIRRAAEAASVAEESLQQTLGTDYRQRLQSAGVQVDQPLPPKRLVLPFLLSDAAVEVLRDIPYIDDGNRRHRLDYGARPNVCQRRRDQHRCCCKSMAEAGWLVTRPSRADH